MKFKKIGFIGQGYIGKNYADDFESRGFEVIRYGLDPEFAGNRERIKHCDLVFIAVPTPSTPDGFDYSTVEEVLSLVGRGASVVIKSTVLPKTTETLQTKFSEYFLFHSPEFLTEATAEYDAGHPDRNIVGMAIENGEFKERAEAIMDALPYAPYVLVTNSRTAEMIKYAGNNWFFVKVVFVNMLYDLSATLGLEWEVLEQALSADPRIGNTHLSPIHKNGRGAGGNCFIKDFSAFSEMYRSLVGDEHGVKLLEELRDKNIELLLKSNKDIEKLSGVYGEDYIRQKKRAQ
ncbi:MAG: hypothetical protein WDZ88_04250 [Candidatus Paceibacterota bacterium]